jgi:formylglycine-generating enzyme required for sulfatase activity
MGSDPAEIGFALAVCRAEPMGESCEEEWFADEFAPHSVELSDFWIDRNEVTVAEYRRCVDVGPCVDLPLAAGGRRLLEPSFPATMVTWSDAVTFCKFRGGRLPTEAEWERAARGVKSRRYPWGNVFDPYFVNGGRFGLDWYEDKDGFLELAPVGTFVHGQTPDLIADLIGNAEEWVADWWGPEYPLASENNPKGPSVGDEKVVRGGSYIHGKHSLRAAERNKDVPSARRPWRGFRCAYDP